VAGGDTDVATKGERLFIQVCQLLKDSRAKKAHSFYRTFSQNGCRYRLGEDFFCPSPKAPRKSSHCIRLCRAMRQDPLSGDLQLQEIQL